MPTCGPGAPRWSGCSHTCVGPVGLGQPSQHRVLGQLHLVVGQVELRPGDGDEPGASTVHLRRLSTAPPGGSAKLGAVTRGEGFDDRLVAVMAAAFRLAQCSGRLTTADLLLAAVRADGPVRGLGLGERLGGRVPPSTAGFATAGDGGPENGQRVHVGPYARQAIGSARAWAASRGERASPEHLVVVLIDQASPGVVALLAEVGASGATLRRAALSGIGARPDHATVALLPLAPSGTMDRPPLAVDALPQGAWQLLRRRQERLPLRHLRRRRDWSAMSLNEQRAAMAVADRLGLDDHQRYSLLHHHLVAVRAKAAAAAPRLVGAPSPPGQMSRAVGLYVRHGDRPPRRLVRHGWACWVGNRRVALRARWLRLTSQR